MRGLARIAAIILALLLLLAIAIGGASELGGEVVVLRTTDAADGPAETRLWVVDDAGHAWLRAGDPSSGWYRRLQARPSVEVTRGGKTRAYRAVPVPSPGARDRVHALMAAKYGWANAVVGLLGDRSASVAVRLDLPEPQSQASP